MDEKDKSRYLGDVEYFSAKLEQDPESELFVPLAKAYIKLEKYDEAVQVLTAGIDARDDILSAKTMLARAYLGLAKIDDAKAILTEVMVVDRNNYLASKLMGDIQRNENDIKKALVSYRNALMVAPEDIELKNLVEELMSASGIAAHELDEEISLMEADDEMLDKLGSELAEEVRQQVGEAELGSEEASAEEVGKTIDDIIGGKAMGDDEDEDMSLDNFEEDGEFGDELEEEMVASIEDSIIPMDLSSDNAQPAVTLDKEIMDADDGEEAPDEDAVKALAAELGADLGLELGEAPSAAPADEVDEALSSLFDEEGASEGEAVDGMSFFEDVADEPADEVDEEELLNQLSAADAEENAKGEVDEVAEAMAMLEGESSDDKADDVAAAMAELGMSDDEPLKEPADETDDVAAAMAELGMSDDEPLEEPADETDDVAAAMAELEAEQEPEEVAHAQDFDELQDMLSGAEAFSEEGEESDEITAEDVFEASMDELLESGPQDTDETEENDTDELAPETREQVNRLENLLEIIKNNSHS